MKRTFWIFFGATVAWLASAGSVGATVVYTGATYSQDFDSLPSSGSPLAWTNDSTLPGWSLFVQPAPGNPRADAGHRRRDQQQRVVLQFRYSFRFGPGPGRFGVRRHYFGSPTSGNVAGWWAVAITNGTGSDLDAFTVSFDGEQWRNGGNTNAQTMTLQYGFGNAFGDVTTWNTPGGSFNFISPVTGSTAAALDGNAPANRQSGLGGTISGLSWGDGTNLWVRWVENNDVGNDHGLAIDNFSFSAQTAIVPEPSTFVLAFLSLLGLVGLHRSRRRCNFA